MARTKLFSLLRRTYGKALIANELGLRDPVAIEAAWRARREEAGHSRRQMLSLLGGSAAIAALGSACGDDSDGSGGGGGGTTASTTTSTTGSSTTTTSSSSNGGGGGGGGPPAEENVVVVGAGIAGLHCAWRLQEAGVQTTVYELHDRVGGRMFTGRNLFPEGQICELGGELIDSNHATLFALSEELDIALDDRFEGEPVGHARDTYFIEGALVPEETILEQFQEVAGIMAADRDAADTDDAAYEALDLQSLDDYLNEKVPRATYPELHDILQTAYRGEFGLENDQQSALNMLYLIGSDETDTFQIFGESDERYHTHDGNDVFPTRIAERLEEGSIVLEHRLTRIADAEGGFELTFDNDGTDVTVNATRIVFALPFSTLRDVDLEDLTLSDEKREIIAELGYGTNAKVMGGFDRRVWLEDHNASGSLSTDLAIQQTWDTTIGQAGTRGILTNFIGGDHGLELQGVEADAWWQAGPLDDLELVWPGTRDAYSGDAVKFDWPNAPGAKGSYTCYRPGQWAYYGLEGAPEGRLHFCGEHTSLDFQGWMEGGAESGAMAAAQILDELGLAMSEAHVRSLGVKLLYPQSVYRRSGGMTRPDGRRMNPFERRRRMRDSLRAFADRLQHAR